MATITRRESGRWQAKVRRHGVALSETFSTRGDAEAWARRMESEVERGLWRDSTEAERTTLAEALERYAREITPRKRSVKAELSRIRWLAAHPLGRVTLARIRSADIAAYRDERLRTGMAPASVRLELALISHLYTVARREWGIEGIQNPVQAAAKPQVRNARSRRVTDAEIEAICAASRSHELPALVRLAVETAMRRGELLALKWEHVDLARRVAHLPQTKNGEARDVQLSSRAVEILRSLPRRIDGRVFGMTPDGLTQSFERACRRAGIRDLHFHDLRHEATSRLAERLPGILELSAVTDHKDLRMLKRYYHPRAEDLARKLG